MNDLIGCLCWCGSILAAFLLGRLAGQLSKIPEVNDWRRRAEFAEKDAKRQKEMKEKWEKLTLEAKGAAEQAIALYYRKGN